jgi:hypothetical protein
MASARSIVAIMLLVAGCGGGGDVVKGSDQRLAGEWDIELTMSPVPFGRAGDTATVQGTVAFVPNRAGTRVPSFGGTPQQLGTHNARLDRLIPDLDPRTAVPMAAGSSAGDSVRLVLDPGSSEPIVLRGVWQDEGVQGEWTAHRRAGIDKEGRFTLRRPTP